MSTIIYNSAYESYYFHCWRDLEVTSASGLLANCTLLTNISCEILIEFKSLFRKLISINSTFLSKIKMMPSLKVKRTLISVNDSHQLKMTLLCANQVCRKKSIYFWLCWKKWSYKMLSTLLIEAFNVLIKKKNNFTGKCSINFFSCLDNWNWLVESHSNYYAENKQKENYFDLN